VPATHAANGDTAIASVGMCTVPVSAVPVSAAPAISPCSSCRRFDARVYHDAADAPACRGWTRQATSFTNGVLFTFASLMDHEQ
jgi:hypothetical protein